MTETPDQLITFRKGQSVPWPHAPGGVAQVVDLMRANVRLFYPTKQGKARFALVNVRRLAEVCRRQPLLFEQINPYQRGLVPDERTYVVRQIA